MKHRIIVGQVKGVHVISDDGAISRVLGLPSTPWHLVSDTRDGIGMRVEQMEALLDCVLPSKGRITSTTTVGTMTKKLATAGTVNGNGDGKLTIHDLGLDARQLWRLEKAVGGKGLTNLGRLTEAQLVAKKGIGPAIVKSVKKGLKKHGLRLTEPVG